jgi:AAA domain
MTRRVRLNNRKPAKSGDARNRVTVTASPPGTLAGLMQMDLPDLQYLVPDLWPEGVGILGAAPKIGKTAMLCQLWTARAVGGLFLDRQLVKGRPLFLALEDSDRSLQDLVRRQSPNLRFPETAYYKTSWPQVRDGGLRRLERFIQRHKITDVLIDTLHKFTGTNPNSRSQTQYQKEYDAASEIHDLAIRLGVNILSAHHTNQRQSVSDWTHRLVGSNGLIGAADTVTLLDRDRDQSAGVMHVTGREIPEIVEYLEYDGEAKLWLVGIDAPPPSGTRPLILEELRQASEALSPRQMADRLGIRHNTVKQQLHRMKREGVVVVASEDGRYVLAPGYGDTVTPSADPTVFGPPPVSAIHDPEDEREEVDDHGAT